MKMIPLGDRVIVRLLETEEKKKGGIIIPDTAKERPSRGRSRRGRQRSSHQFRRALGARSQDGRPRAVRQVRRQRDRDRGSKYLVMKEDEILAIL